MTSLKHNRCLRHRCRLPLLTRCCCHKGSNCKQKSSMSPNKATISLTRTSSADGVGCTHHPTEEVSRCLLLTLRLGHCFYWETPSNSGLTEDVESACSLLPRY